MKALVYTEVDIGFCRNKFGIAPCRGCVEGLFFSHPSAGWNFDDKLGSVHGWTAGGFSSTSSVAATDDGMLYETLTGTDPILTSDVISVAGSTDKYVTIEYERVRERTSGAWDGTAFLMYAGSTAWISKSFSDSPVGQRRKITLDMSTGNTGGAWSGAFTAKTFTLLRIDLDAGPGGQFLIHSIAVGHDGLEGEATGTDKCYNTKSTCQDRVNYDEREITLRFGLDTGFMPSDIEAFPSLVDEPSYTPSTIDLGQSLGQRASVVSRFKDHPHNDTGDGFDLYRSERDYDPMEQGTFWGKFRARQPFLYGNKYRLIRGELGDAIEDMETEHFIVESFDGPSVDGYYTITAKDPLKLADSDRAQAPVLSNGYLLNDVTNVATTLLMTPVGVGHEYPTSGYVAVGGKEIMSFTRDGGLGNDAFTVVLNHFDGANNATTSSDVNLGGSAKTWTFNGNAKLTTADKVFGTAALTLDGTGDYITTPDHVDFAFGSGDFCVDARFKCEAADGVERILCGQTDASLTTTNTSFWIGRTSGNKMYGKVYVGSTLYQVTGTTNIVAPAAWHHVKLERNGTTLSLYVDGVLEASVAISGAVNNSTAVLAIGRAGAYTSLEWNGKVDEFRVSKGTSRSDEELQTAAYNTLSFDQLNVTRAQYNTTAVALSGQDRVQLCLRYVSADPVDILRELLVDYAGVNDNWIPIANWQAESAAFLQRVYSALIAEPTSVKKLINELIEQAAMAVWWDSVAQEIKLQILRAIQTSAVAIDESNYERQSFDVKDQPEKRITQVWTYYGQYNPLKKIDEADNYRSAVKDFALQSQSDYGSAAIKKIFSRWIGSGGRTVAERLNSIQIARFQVAPRRVRFKMFKHDQAVLSLGLGAQIGNRSIQDAAGAREVVPIQITRLHKDRAYYNVEAEEMRFNVPDDFNDRYIFIDASQSNVNIRTLYDELYPAPSSTTVVNFIVSQGVTVWSTSTALSALAVGDWPVGAVINVYVDGYVVGRGGLNSSGNGGVALYTRFPINLYVRPSGIIGGGGGGGGDGAPGIDGTYGTYPGGAGGHGAGILVGDNWLTATPGNPPPTGFPNIISMAGGGGAGGELGQNGAGGGNATGGTPGYPGGTAGAAINGISYVTLSNLGDIFGTTVN